MLRVLVYHNGRRFIAQGVEHDFVAQGKSVASARKAFTHGLLGMMCLADHLGIKEPLGHLSPSPKSIEARFKNAIPLKGESEKLPRVVKYTIKWDGQKKTKGELRHTKQKLALAVQ